MNDTTYLQTIAKRDVRIQNLVVDLEDLWDANWAKSGNEFADAIDEMLTGDARSETLDALEMVARYLTPQQNIRVRSLRYCA
jgi:hypothetical protein